MGGSLVVEISQYKKSQHFKNLNRADANDEKTGYNGKIDTDAERKKAAELICGKEAAADVTKAEACLKKSLNIQAAKAEADSKSTGAEIKGVSSNWGKEGLIAKAQKGALEIKGSLA